MLIPQETAGFSPALSVLSHAPVLHRHNTHFHCTSENLWLRPRCRAGVEGVGLKPSVFVGSCPFVNASDYKRWLVG